MIIQFSEEEKRAAKDLMSQNTTGVLSASASKKPKRTKLGQFFRGISKGVLQLSALGERTLATITPGKQTVERTGLTGAEELFPEKSLKGSTPIEKAGVTAFDVGSLVAPQVSTSKFLKFIDTAKDAFSLSDKAAKALKIASKASLDTGSATAFSAMKQGDVDEKEIKEGLISGGLSVGLGALTQFGLPKLADKIQKASLRLTAAQKRNLGTRINETIKFLNEEKIVGSPSTRTQKVRELINETEDTLQTFLNKSDKTIDRNELIERLNASKIKYANNRDYNAIVRQIDSVVSQIETQFDETIPVQAANEFKRSAMSGAYNRAGEKVLDEVEFDIGDTVYKLVAESLGPDTIGGLPITEFNKRYSNLLTAKKLLETTESKRQATGMERALVGLLSGFAASQTSTPALVPLVGIGAAQSVEEFAKYRNVLAALAQVFSEQEIQGISKILPAIIDQIENQ